MKISLIEVPSIHYRDDTAIVIFPSKPYWFSATKEIGIILNSLHFEKPKAIIKNIAQLLQVSREEAKEIYTETTELLYSAGVLAINGKTAEIHTSSPDFQVNDVENVLVIGLTPVLGKAIIPLFAHPASC